MLPAGGVTVVRVTACAIEMNFLPDVYVQCDVCKGRRYNRETLQVVFKGKSIADVLEMTVAEAVSFSRIFHQFSANSGPFNDVGLGYIRLGQQATTLSGGEAQRIKLDGALKRWGPAVHCTFWTSPTTGLHFEDVRMLLGVLNRLVEKGNTVIVIEHNLDMIKCADWVIDMGPGEGRRGGSSLKDRLRMSRTVAGSATAEFLRHELSRR